MRVQDGRSCPVNRREVNVTEVINPALLEQVNISHAGTVAVEKVCVRGAISKTTSPEVLIRQQRNSRPTGFLVREAKRTLVQKWFSSDCQTTCSRFS